MAVVFASSALIEILAWQSTTICSTTATGIARRVHLVMRVRRPLHEAQYVGLAKKVEQAFDERFAARSDELAELAANRRRLEDESDKLLATHFADAIDLTTLKRHQDRIRAGLADIDRRIENEHDQDQGPRRQIAKALRLLIDCQRLYKSADAHGKRLANQTFTTSIDINEDEEATIRLVEPFAVTTGESTHVRCLSMSETVDPRGLEPLTPCLQSRCATNCAMGPGEGRLYAIVPGPGHTGGAYAQRTTTGDRWRRTRLPPLRRGGSGERATRLRGQPGSGRRSIARCACREFRRPRGQDWGRSWGCSATTLVFAAPGKGCEGATSF